MGKTTGFLEYGRIDPRKRPPLERIRDFDEIRLPQDDEEIRTQGSRCMNCGIPYCASGVLLNGMAAGCPLHNLIPEWNDLVYKNQWQDAFERLIRTNPFPEFTARVCPAPCEGSCTEGHILDAVAISSIEYQIIEKAYKEGWVKPVRSSSTGKSVAIVGSGPSGLSTAYFLNASGHHVTIYERSDRPGGLLMYGIPNMKLGKKILDRRIEVMKESGISFVLNTEVGKDLPTQDLVDRYDAVVLCSGATQGRGIAVEGKDLTGVHFAVDFLKAATQSVVDPIGKPISALDVNKKKVVILGGGDTGTDCVASALRQGCESVVQFEILPEAPKERDDRSNPWPEWPKKLKTDYGQEEAIATTGNDPRHYLISTRKIVGDSEGNVSEIHTVDVQWVKDPNGRMIPKEVPGTEKVWPADKVLLAMGFLGPEATILDELKLSRDPRGSVATEDGKFKTRLDSVFACGDMRRGQSLVVWAIQEGKLCAREVDRYLMGKSR
ncbi:MAG TPA: glutamate synthase [Erysipelotrichaceae bacterium]|nr:glutamate synthase [Erysipelotrichaceae bacterium]